MSSFRDLTIDACRGGFVGRRLNVVMRDGSVRASDSAVVLGELVKKAGIAAQVRPDFYALANACSDCRRRLGRRTADAALRAGRIPRCLPCFRKHRALGEAAADVGAAKLGRPSTVLPAVLAFVAMGSRSTKEIASHLGVAPRAAHNFVQRLRAKGSIAFGPRGWEVPGTSDRPLGLPLRRAA